MKFVRNPVEAEQFTIEGKDRCFNMCNGQARADRHADGRPFMRITGPQGAQNITLGDWVVRDGFDLYGYTDAEFQLKFSPEVAPADDLIKNDVIPEEYKPSDSAIAACTLFRWWHRRRAQHHAANVDRMDSPMQGVYDSKWHAKWRDYHLARLAEFK